MIIGIKPIKVKGYFNFSGLMINQKLKKGTA